LLFLGTQKLEAADMGSYVSDWLQPGNFKASCGGAFARNLKPTSGDISCFISLFFDNLATIVAGCAIIQCTHHPTRAKRHAMSTRPLNRCARATSS
jgi:hypothetical protein